jgi:hypothetical protein
MGYAALVFVLSVLCAGLIRAISTYSLGRREHLPRLSKLNPKAIRVLVEAFSVVEKDKLLYHRLQNPSTLDHGVIKEARTRLLDILGTVICKNRPLTQLHSDLLGVPGYSQDAVSRFIQAGHDRTAKEWAAYLARRTSGGLRELLLNRDHAVHWLERAAPVKFADGAWLSRLHHPKTTSRYLPVTRIAWQTFSEELGDGDLEKNHVHLYKGLLQSCGSKVPGGDSLAFIDARVNPNDDAHVWATAVTQLSLGLFPDEFFPETLGYNLGYECVGIDTLMCAYELKELGLNPQYFNLHITIDNADSGHTAMARDAVFKYMALSGDDDPRKHWTRVQAGLLLAQAMKSSPSAPSKADIEFLRIVSKKLEPAVTAHLSCKGIIGGSQGMNIQMWLDPSNWNTRKFHFLPSLANSRWVEKGIPQQSRLVQELSWGGRMFGAFTATEKTAVENWITGLASKSDDCHGSEDYRDLVAFLPDVKEDYYPLHFSALLGPPTKMLGTETVVLTLPLSLEVVADLLRYTLVTLQTILAGPYQAATLDSMVVLKILRILHGFSSTVADAVDGMDEIRSPTRPGLVELAAHLKCQKNVYAAKERDGQHRLAWEWLDELALNPIFNFSFLVGVHCGLVRNVVMNGQFLRASGADEETTTALIEMGTAANEQLAGLLLCDEYACQLGFTFLSRRLQELRLRYAI